MSNDNIVSLISKTEEPSTIISNYRIEDIEGNIFEGEGFLVFTTQHVAIMTDTPLGSIPVVVVPLFRVKVAELMEDNEEVPF